MLIKTYHSPHRGLVINAEPKVRRIEFVEGIFTTSDPKQIELLERAEAGFGRYIFLARVEGKPEEEAQKDQDVADDGGDDEKQGIVCPVEGCGRSFANKAALTAHLAAHKRKGDM